MDKEQTEQIKKDQIHTLATTFILLHKQLKKRTINI